tara:strand:- start:36733 stop:37191 length:459 start_codon:yes stop_codon:yes gene_type:complete
MTVNKIIIIISILVLISVHLIELIGYEACDLCLKQRWAWYVSLFFAIVSFFTASNISKILLMLISIILFLNALFAGWHSGIEWGLWDGIETCNSSAKFDSNNLINILKQNSIPACGDTALRIFGISLAGYNFIISVLTSIFIMKRIWTKNEY